MRFRLTAKEVRGRFTTMPYDWFGLDLDLDLDHWCVLTVRYVPHPGAERV